MTSGETTQSRLALWVAGARPRTLSASVSPVLVGTAVATREAEAVIAWRAGLALLVALGLQVGVNYANDYADGVRGVDSERQGPVRLTASGLVPARAVRLAAILAFAVAAVAGIVLAVAVDLRLLAVGAVAVLAAGLYSGGPRPYGASGLGEVAVFVFFGLVATCGAAYVHLERVPGLAVLGSVVVGLLACAILIANNLRDFDTDRAAGKRTLAVRLGHRGTRRLYVACIVGSFLAVVTMAPGAPGALVALAALALAVAPLRAVVGGPGDVPSLVGALVGTARLQLVVAVLLAAGLWDW